MERVDEQLTLRETFEGAGRGEMATENIGPRYRDEDLLAFGSIGANDG